MQQNIDFVFKQYFQAHTPLFLLIYCIAEVFIVF